MEKFTDDRGEIINILEGETVKGISLIFSKKGSVRSNHFHKNDSHWLYVISGSMRYYERDLDHDTGSIVDVNEGEMVFSPPMKVHKTVFKEDTWLICMSNKIKSGPDHDMVKQEF